MLINILILISLKKRWEQEKHYLKDIRALMRAIRTDVVRTDRSFKFYSNSGDANVNVQSLYKILVTYCVSHPNIRYCQGSLLIFFSNNSFLLFCL